MSLSLSVFTSILGLWISVVFIYNGDCGNVRIDRLDKTLFKPSVTYPALIHLQPARYHSEILENEATYPRYAYDFNDYTDTLQKQVPFQPLEKRLEGLLQIGDETKYPKNADADDENYDKRANNVFHDDESKFEIEELDRRYKRSQADLSPPVSRSITKERLPFEPYTTWEPPFGPYTTWEPLFAIAEIWRRASHQDRLIRIEPDQNTKKNDEFGTMYVH